MKLKKKKNSPLGYSLGEAQTALCPLRTPQNVAIVVQRLLLLSAVQLCYYTRPSFAAVGRQWFSQILLMDQWQMPIYQSWKKKKKIFFNVTAMRLRQTLWVCQPRGYSGSPLYELRICKLTVIEKFARRQVLEKWKQSKSAWPCPNKAWTVCLLWIL